MLKESVDNNSNITFILFLFQRESAELTAKMERPEIWFVWFESLVTQLASLFYIAVPPRTCSFLILWVTQEFGCFQLNASSVYSLGTPWTSWTNRTIWFFGKQGMRSQKLDS